MRLASRADLAGLVELERGAFADPWTEAQLRDAMDWDGAVAIVAENGDGLIGYVLGRVVVDQAEILSLAVAASHRRRGVGRELLAAALAAMIDRGACSAWLEVRVSNLPARAMYESAGFVTAGLRRDYYRQPLEDAMVLRRDLSRSA
jgi:ribosomal-protein-alanine N-acetyltransferase